MDSWESFVQVPHSADFSKGVKFYESTKNKSDCTKRLILRRGLREAQARVNIV